MPRFRTLSDAVKFQVEQSAPKSEFPLSSPLSSALGQGVPAAKTVQSTNVFRWGESTWGVDTVGPYAFPGQLNDNDVPPGGVN